MPEKNCPLCNADNIPYKGVDYGTANRFYCPVCKDFVIKPFTENHLRTTSADLLKKLSEEASSVSSGNVLFIAINDKKELIHEEQSANEWS